MFGYISPDTPYLFIKDETLYKAAYCGMCKSIGASCGQIARTALTFDMTFVSVLVHNIRHEDVEIKKARCALHFIKRRPMIAVDEISKTLAQINTVLTYYKLADDKADGDKKGIFRHLYKRGLKKAKKQNPEIVKIIDEETKAQRELEKRNCDIIDMACEPSAQMLKRLSVFILGEYSTLQTEALFYDLGKWIYLVDALDDYEKDVKKGRYNPFYNAYKTKTFKEALSAYKDEIYFIFDSLFADMRARLEDIDFKFNRDLTDNIILRGIPLKTRNLCENKK